MSTEAVHIQVGRAAVARYRADSALVGALGDAEQIRTTLDTSGAPAGLSAVVVRCRDLGGYQGMSSRTLVHVEIRCTVRTHLDEDRDRTLHDEVCSLALATAGGAWTPALTGWVVRHLTGATSTDVEADAAGVFRDTDIVQTLLLQAVADSGTPVDPAEPSAPATEVEDPADTDRLTIWYGAGLDRGYIAWATLIGVIRTGLEILTQAAADLLYAPLLHASRHAVDGDDELTPADIGAATAVQGGLADTAVQPGALGTAAAEDVEAFEPALGNPESDGMVLSSTIAGARSWVSQGVSADSLTVTYVGTPRIRGIVALVPPPALADVYTTSGEHAATAATGKWANRIPVYTGFATELSYDDLQGIMGDAAFLASGSPALTSIAFPELVVLDGTVSFAMPVCTSLSLPQLQYARNLTISLPALVSLALPELLHADLLTVNAVAALQTASFPKLASVGAQLSFSASSVITSLSFPVLANCLNGISVFGCSALTALSLPALEHVGTNGIACYFSLGKVAEVTFGSIGNLKRVGGNVDVSGQKLSQASVDHVLAVLASLDGTGGTVAFSAPRLVKLTGGTNATPSAAGLASKAILVARGVTVTHN